MRPLGQGQPGRDVRDLRVAMGTAQGCRVYNNANISIGDTTWTALTFNSERFDTDGIHSVSTNTGRLTAQHAGVYLITGAVAFAPNSTGARRAAIYLNGTSYIARIGIASTGATLETYVSISTIYALAVGDYVELYAYQASGGSLNVNASGNYSPEFGMVRLG